MTREQYAANHVEYAQDRIRQACLDRDPAAFLECVTVEVIAANDHGRAESDLDAQEAMALWAKLMTLASVAGVALTGFGIYLVWGTLTETRKATQAAREAVLVTREIGETQVRAYVSVIEAWVEIQPGGVFAYRVKVKNTGQSPAIGFKMRTFGWVGHTHHDEVAIRHPEKIRLQVFDLGAGIELNNGGNTPLAEIRHPIATSNIIVAGFISYKTVFGKTRRVVFRLHSIVPHIGEVRKSGSGRTEVILLHGASRHNRSN